MKTLILVLMLLGFSIPAFAWQNNEQQEPYKYSFASGPLVNLVKSGAGFLHSITVTGGVTSPVDIYDTPNYPAGTANVIASFATTTALSTYTFDIAFASGCTVVTNGSALKYTVSYR